MKLALGTVQLGTRYGIQNNGRPSREDAEGILELAVKNDIRVFDTAAAYGDAETIIGGFINRKGIKREGVFIITKPPPDIFRGVRSNDYLHVLEKETRKSLGRLRTDYVDALMYHSEKYANNSRAMAALVKLIETGIVRKTGISVYNTDEAFEALRYGIQMIQLPYNVFDRRFEDTGFLKYAKKRGVTVLARSPLLQGLLTMPGEKLPENMKFAEKYVTRFREVCGALGITPLECALGFAARNESNDYVLIGVDNRRQLYEAALAARKELDSGQYGYIRKKFSDVPEKVMLPYNWPSGA